MDEGKLSVIVDRWHPVTHDMGLIDASLEQVVAVLLRWHGSLGTTYSRCDVTSSLADAFEALPPLSAEKRRRLFVATRSGWTACFQSGIDGSDPFPTTSYISTEFLGVLGMRACRSPAGARWPAVIWEVYAPVELGGLPPLCYRRSLCVANDGGRWVFEQSGEPFDFERTETYSLPRKRDRFTPELLDEYLAHFDLQPFSDSFYVVSARQPAVVLECQQRWPHSSSEFSLEEVLAGLPWKQ